MKFFPWAWSIATLLFLGICGLKAGPFIEGHFWPVRGPQSTEVILRERDRLCWSWTMTKLRSIASDNLDAFLEINGEQAGIAAPYDMESGRPWGITKFALAPRPEPYTLHLCVAIPPYVAAGDTIRVRQIAFYPGFLGLWRLSVPFPDVNSPSNP